MRYILLTVLLIIASVQVGIGIELAWNANSEEDLAGYNLYLGNESGLYSTYIDVGNVTGFDLGESQNDLYISLSAYDLADNESDLCDELVVLKKPEGSTNLRSNNE